MKAILSRVGLNELLGCPLLVSFNLLSFITEAIQPTLFYVEFIQRGAPLDSLKLRCLNQSAKQPNARINRAGSIEPSIQVLRMKDKLIPLRLNELLDRPLDSTIQLAS